MQRNPALHAAEFSMTHPIRAMVKGVRYRDTARGKVTVVDALAIDRTGHSINDRMLFHVPVMYQKMNAQNGEEWTPEVGDLVAVGFFNANLRDPFVMGYLGPFDGDTMDGGTEAHPRVYWRRSGTWEEIDKDGNRTTHIAKNDTLVVEGVQDIHIKGGTGTPALVVQVDGKADITVTEETKLTCPVVKVIASTSVTVDTPITTLTGNLTVNGGITATGTYGSTGGKIQTPGDIKSTSGEVWDKTRNISGDRTIYNSHTHPDPQGGSVAAPTEKQ
jgi:phage baseplate assembly protein gpV